MSMRFATFAQAISKTRLTATSKQHERRADVTDAIHFATGARRHSSSMKFSTKPRAWSTLSACTGSTDVNTASRLPSGAKSKRRLPSEGRPSGYTERTRVGLRSPPDAARFRACPPVALTTRGSASCRGRGASWRGCHVSTRGRPPSACWMSSQGVRRGEGMCPTTLPRRGPFPSGSVWRQAHDGGRRVCTGISSRPGCRAGASPHFRRPA
jgi:hypothetical protein